MEKNLFELATRCKYRFPYRGQITIEDLWDLHPTDLDSVFKTLNAEAKKASEESLLEPKTEKDEELSNKIEIIKYIVSTKLAEQAAKESEKANKEKKQKLLAIKARREEAALENISDEQLNKMINEL
nr:MAG TPA: hypothetical protein [Bacteriophage sp.]